MSQIPQSTARRQVFKAYLASDHVTAATGKTLAVVISKNGGAFGNPSAGATNATEIANGWYYVDLSTTDTATAGPLIVRATAADVDDVEVSLFVGDAVANLSATGCQQVFKEVHGPGHFTIAPAALGGSDSNAGTSWSYPKLSPKTFIEGEDCALYSTVHFAAGVYDIGANEIEVPYSVKLVGEGKYQTWITSSISNPGVVSGGTIIIRPQGLNAFKSLAVIATAADGTETGCIAVGDLGIDGVSGNGACFEIDDCFLKCDDIPVATLATKTSAGSTTESCGDVIRVSNSVLIGKVEGAQNCAPYTTMTIIDCDIITPGGSAVVPPGGGHSAGDFSFGLYAYGNYSTINMHGGSLTVLDGNTLTSAVNTTSLVNDDTAHIFIDNVQILTASATGTVKDVIQDGYGKIHLANVAYDPAKVQGSGLTLSGVDAKLIKNVDANTAISARVDASTKLTAVHAVKPAYTPSVSASGKTAATVAAGDGVDAAAVAGKMAGITLLAKWLRGLFRKDAMDATAKSEINEDGGTYDEATDSVQATRDRGDAAWVTGSGATDAALFTGAFSAAVLANAPTGATATYTVSKTSVGESPRVDITQYRYAAFGPVAITTTASQTGDSHAFLVYDPLAPTTVLWSLTTGGGEIAVGGTGDKTLTLTDTDAHTATPGTWAYVLRNTSDDTVVCVGALTIVEVPNVPA